MLILITILIIFPSTTFTDKENDIDLKTTALQKKLESERMHQRKLHVDISQLQAQLLEAKNGLMAAARLSDQLELNQLTIDKLNNESKFLSTYLSIHLLLIHFLLNFSLITAIIHNHSHIYMKKMFSTFL